MVYNSSMKIMKKHFLHFLLSSFLFFALCAIAVAEPGSDGFPPLPPVRDLPGEDSPVNNRFPRPPMDSENIINYRGNRTYTENLPLKINQIKCERRAEDVVCVEIVFNQSLNPRSFHHDCLCINNAPLPFGSRFIFNKKGNTIKIMVPSTVNTFKLKIQNISSFNGSVIEPVEILAEVMR